VAGGALLTLHADLSSGIRGYLVGETTVYLEWPLVQRVLAGEQDDLGDKYADLVAAPWGTAIYTAGPIRNGETLVGVVLVGAYLPDVAGDLFEQSRAGVSVYAPDGRPLASSLTQTPGEMAALSADTVSELQSTGAGSLLTRAVRAGSRDYVEALGPLFLRGAATQYVQGVALPEALVTEQQGPSAFQLAAWFTAAILAVIGLGVVIAQIIAVPVFELLNASAHVAQGDLQVQVDVKSQDEIGNLTTSFNTMTKDLKKYIKQLAETTAARERIESELKIAHDIQMGILPKEFS